MESFAMILIDNSPNHIGGLGGFQPDQVVGLSPGHLTRSDSIDLGDVSRASIKYPLLNSITVIIIMESQCPILHGTTIKSSTANKGEALCC
jgi:hypothetical protein